MSLSEQSLALHSQSTQHLAPAGEETRTPGGGGSCPLQTLSFLIRPVVPDLALAEPW